MMNSHSKVYKVRDSLKTAIEHKFLRKLHCKQEIIGVLSAERASKVTHIIGTREMLVSKLTSPISNNQMIFLVLVQTKIRLHHV